MMEDSRIFIDTNVLVYASVIEAPFCLIARGLLKKLELAGTELWISRQIIREFFAQMTRAQHPNYPPKALYSVVRDFEKRFSVADDQALVLDQLVFLMEHVPTGGRQVHDANIVATMLAHNVHQLATFNTKDFRRFSQFIELVPTGT